MADFESLDELQRWCRRAPHGTHIDVRGLAEILEQVAGSSPVEPTVTLPHPADGWTWRERLWTAPPDTLLGVTELAEAVGHSKDWVYNRTRSKADKPIPHGKLDGSLVFAVGEVRQWLRAHVETLVEGDREGPWLDVA